MRRFAGVPMMSLVLFQGIRPIAIKLYFFYFSGGGGGGGGGSEPPVPPLWIRPCVHTPPNSDPSNRFHVLH